MANEKMKILQMLEEGKITSAEAARLLDSAGDPAPRAARPAGNGGPQESFREPAPDGRRSETSRQNAPPPARGDDFISDLGRKFETFAKDLEPKIIKLTDSVAEKTVQLTDSLSKSLSQTEERSYRAPSPAQASGAEKNFELPVEAGYNELSMSCINGNVMIRGYNGDKITARVTVRPRKNARASKEIALMRLGNKYFLSYEEDDYEAVSVDAYIPENLFNVLNISNTNGNSDISTVKSDIMSFVNSNGRVKLNNLMADSIQAECDNGPLVISQVAAKNAKIENFNGVIDALDLDVSGLSLISFNGGITLNASSLARHTDYVWAAETSNGKMTLNLPTMPDLGYHIKASTSLSSIKVGLVGLNYIVNTANMIEAKSISFDSCHKKAKLVLETSNGPLVVN